MIVAALVRAFSVGSRWCVCCCRKIRAVLKCLVSMHAGVKSQCTGRFSTCSTDPILSLSIRYSALYLSVSLTVCLSVCLSVPSSDNRPCSTDCTHSMSIWYSCLLSTANRVTQFRPEARVNIFKCT